MKPLRLKVDDLHVESYATVAPAPGPLQHGSLTYTAAGWTMCGSCPPACSAECW